MDKGVERIYKFEEFRLDEEKRLVFNPSGESVPLMPKAFDILSYLVRHSGKVVEKDELMAAIWPDTIVEENNLTQNISALRRLLGERHRENRFIATVPGRGYKFVADVSVEDSTRRENSGSSEGDDFRGRTNTTLADGRTNEGRVNGTVRTWLIGLTGFVLLGLVSLAFLLWPENAGRMYTGEIRSIAVLPFKPMSSENRDESQEMGMADALISELSSSQNLTVRPLSSVRRFASLEQDSIAAGRALGVEAVLDGSIQASGDRVRVTTQLIRVSDGKHLWSGQFDERSADIFVLQDSISERVANALRITLGSRGARRYTESVEAYQFYMKGNFHASRLILPEVDKAISYYEQALAVDPSYAMAYVGIANAGRAMVLTNDAKPAEVMPKAKIAALKAIELDESLAEARTTLAFISFWYDFDWQTAEKHHIRALELDPYSAQSHVFYAHMLSNTGRQEEALAEIKRARELDPVSLVTNAIEGQILFFAGKEDEALKVLQSTAEMEPNFWLAQLFLSRVYLKKGMYPESIAAATLAKDITRGNSEAMATMAEALAESGKTNVAQAVLKDMEDRQKTRYVPSYALAQVNNVLGERDKALDLLEKAFDQKDALMVFLKVEPKWNDIRSEPRFIELMKKMNFN